jgi:hypothetical protein
LTQLSFGHDYNFNQPIELNYVHHSLNHRNLTNVSASINHIPLDQPSVDTFKRVKSIQDHFRNTITPDLIRLAFHPRRIAYSLSHSHGDLEDTLDGHL